MAPPSVEMLWESVDADEALASRFKLGDAGQTAEWATKVLGEVWGVVVTSCDRIVISGGNALLWVTGPEGPMIAKCSALPWLFPRLANVAQLTSWLHGRGVPVSAPRPALDGSAQVELDGLSVGLQSVVGGSMLDVQDPDQVYLAGQALANLHLALAEYPHSDLGIGGQADSAPMRTRVESWLESPAAAGDVAPLAGRLRHALGSLPNPDQLAPPQLVHLDIRSANLLCDGNRVAAILDFEEAGTDYPLYDLARAAVLLGARFRNWQPVPPETHERFVAGYRTNRELSPAEMQWLKALILWRTLQIIPFGHEPTSWAESAEYL